MARSENCENCHDEVRRELAGRPQFSPALDSDWNRAGFRGMILTYGTSAPVPQLSQF